MGQSASTAATASGLTRSDTFHSYRPGIKLDSSISSIASKEEDLCRISFICDSGNIFSLPDECLACIFHFLGAADRIRCSLVCRRWLVVEGQSRHRLSLRALSDLSPLIPSLLSRFDAVTKLVLKCDYRSPSIGDDAIIEISQRCRKLTHLKLRSCRFVTDVGMGVFAKNCKGLKKLSLRSCAFGAKGMNAVVNNTPNLEELSVKRLRCLTGIGDPPEPIGPGVAGSSLKTICLKELYNGQCFWPLISGSKNLRRLKLLRCDGYWDEALHSFADRVTGFVELHLEKLDVSDHGLSAISNCSDLEILHLVKTTECTNAGLLVIAERCKLLRKLHIDGWKANQIGDVGLIAVAKCCPNLQELVLIGINPTHLSLEMLASNCKNLERLALCGSDTVGDEEISCLATKCIALKKLCIKNCPVSDHGIQALAVGCPGLVKIKIKKCKGVTIECMNWLSAARKSVDVNLDYGAKHPVVDDSEIGANPDTVEGAQVVSRMETASTVSSSTGRPTSFKSRLRLFSGKNFMACTLRRLSTNNSSSRSNSRIG